MNCEAFAPTTDTWKRSISCCHSMRHRLPLPKRKWHFAVTFRRPQIFADYFFFLWTLFCSITAEETPTAYTTTITTENQTQQDEDMSEVQVFHVSTSCAILVWTNLFDAVLFFDLQIIKCDSSESILIEDTEYVEVANTRNNRATNVANVSFPMPMVASNRATTTVNNTARNYDRMSLPAQRISTSSQQQNHTNNAPTNHQQNVVTTVPAPPIDEHEIFGELVVREMRRMTPDAKKAFKRNVTQLLYS